MSTGVPQTDTAPNTILSEPPSAFAEKLGTNYVPSDPEIADIRRLVHSESVWAQNMARMDEEIQEMQLALDQLKAKRDALKETFDAHRALISPLRLTPDDILREIFVACLPTLHNALMDTNQAPLIFGRICRRWRVVAHSTPMLWSSVYVPLTTSADISISSISAALKHWLERSGSCSLDISLYALKPHHSSVIDTGSTLPILLDAASRLRRLSLAGDLEAFQPLLLLGAKSLPLLNSLHLYNGGLDDHRVLEHGMKIIGIPSLRSVSLSINVNALSLPLQWSHLRTIDLWHEGDPSADCFLGCNEWLEILRRCPNLQRCEVYISESLPNDFTFSPDTAPITLPSLEILKMFGDFRLANWAPRLSMPNLLYLRLGFLKSQFRRVDIPPTSSHMVASIDCTLLSRSGLYALLSSFPTLSHLELLAYYSGDQGYTVDDALLAELCPPHNVCQMLTHLVIHPPTKISHASVSDFIRARIHSHPPLQQVEAHFLAQKVDIAPDIQSFVDNGLRLKFEYLPVRSTWPFNPSAGIHAQDDFM
ncbi:hypothetical protein R3P38DRAFT_2827554 [Favolaschia claudopus]|uniref:F-box domain-containing protein n=1 Tax=Favolaschia claudopus TaxID=2862362 RepID=A0AAW0EL22_9AGAR